MAAQAVRLDPSKKSGDLEKFENALRSKIVGQDDAIKALAEIYQMYKAGLAPEGRPVGTLLFLGPTGSGKTRTVEAASEVIFGHPNAIIRIDCGEFQHSHEIAKLIGSPPGYLGHRETHAALTSTAIRAHHTEKDRITFLLFDEIEKASDALWQLLLSIMDKGVITLGTNEKVDLSCCVIVMTSNLGAKEMATTRKGVGFSPVQVGNLDRRLESVAIEAAKAKFMPEFINRLDKMVVFRTLTPEEITTIAKIELGKFQRQLLKSYDTCIFVKTTKEALEYISKEGYDDKYNARNLKRAIEVNIVHPVSNLLSTQQVEPGNEIEVHVNEDGSGLHFIKTSSKVLPKPDATPRIKKVTPSPPIIF